MVRSTSGAQRAETERPCALYPCTHYFAITIEEFFSLYMGHISAAPEAAMGLWLCAVAYLLSLDRLPRFNGDDGRDRSSLLPLNRGPFSVISE